MQTETNKFAGGSRFACLTALTATLLLASSWVWAAEATAQSKSVDGAWQGALSLGAIELRVVFHLAQQPDGKLKATMDSPDQGAKGIKVELATREGDRVKLDVKAVRGTYDGKLSDDGQEIRGVWKQAGPALPLNLKRLDKEPDYRRPQDPVPPLPYESLDVTYENKAAKVRLAGTFTYPKNARGVPAVLLLTGSGAQDRDEALLGHRPFLVLADYLTRRGIAVLRVDDRGVGGSTGNSLTATTADLAADALAGVAFLKSRPEVNPRKIGLVGHSEGGIIAPLAAIRSPDVAFIVLLAGTGVSGEEILYHQGELIARVQKAGEKSIADARDLQSELFRVLRDEPDNAKALEKIARVVDESESLAKAPTEEAKAAVRAEVQAQAQGMITPWFRYFLTYDPAPTLSKVRCPVLALNGEKDLQVDPRQNLPPIERALKASGNRDVTIKELPGLNHLFQHSETGSPAEYGRIDETFAPEALQIVGDWIVARTK